MIIQVHGMYQPPHKSLSFVTHSAKDQFKGHIMMTHQSQYRKKCPDFRNYMYYTSAAQSRTPVIKHNITRGFK